MSETIDWTELSARAGRAGHDLVDGHPVVVAQGGGRLGHVVGRAAIDHHSGTKVLADQA